MVTDDEVYNRTLADNEVLIAKFAAKHNIDGVREIEVSSRYADRETAGVARTYLKKKYAIKNEILFHVVMRKFETYQTIDLTFDLLEKPTAELVTKYELMLLDAAEKHGGETPGWEIRVK